MKILSFAYEQDGWVLEPVTFNGFNLLVGISGAGKTRILDALQRAFDLALATFRAPLHKDDDERPWGATFSLEFEHDDAVYTWEVQTEDEPEMPGVDAGGPHAAEPPLIRKERICRDQVVVVERGPDVFLFNGGKIPLLDQAHSAISLLRSTPEFSPLHQAFSLCLFGWLEYLPAYGSPYEAFHEKYAQRYQVDGQSAGPTLDQIGADFLLPIHQKADLLQRFFPEEFSGLGDWFQQAFPNVAGLDLLRTPSKRIGKNGQKRYDVALVANEPGVSPQLPFHLMSSGMQRYLSFLVHLSFAPRGTVVLIDELEASFGINCLPAATQFLMKRAPDLQFIVTSHHPYIVQQIPPEYWKVVTRKGRHVRVLDASAIPALASKSRLDNFTRLINLPEYEHGVQA